MQCHFNGIMQAENSASIADLGRHSIDTISHSMLVQASVSVFWIRCALARMIRATRLFWFIGGALLAATVVRLFLFDLSHVTGIERIVSFIGIGLMLLLIGYFSPLPPRSWFRKPSDEACVETDRLVRCNRRYGDSGARGCGH